MKWVAYELSSVLLVFQHPEQLIIFLSLFF